MTDQLLINRVRGGEEEAFQVLYQRFRDPLYRFAYRLTSSAPQAEDLVHDCFVTLFRGGFDEQRGSLRTYMYAAVRNLSRKHFRDTGREELTEDFEIAADADPLDGLLAREVAEEVKAAVEALPLLQREVLLLAEYEELSLEEIAKIVDADVSAVKSRLHRARVGLKKTIDRKHERNDMMELKNILEQWEPPQPSSALDRRVYAAFRTPAKARSNFWIPIAAAAAGVLVVGGFWMQRPIEIEMESGVVASSSGVTAETSLDIKGFQPIPNAKLIVIDKGN